MRVDYVAVNPGEIFPLTQETRGLFHRVEQHPQAVQVGALLCPKQLVISPVSRALLLEPFLDTDEAFSHHTARWIHLGTGNPFPICVVSEKRRRKPTQKLVFFRAHWALQVDTSLPVPVLSEANIR
ncbi:hypothetical protein NXS08_02730 [Gleimia sp. 6138-11-ORH1]|uniref:hypothetical protein n=1 Tax=Gleimia sp. 6138-11-ORH1 TaxID=2973937 RepID=UPI00216A8728|nr:hypothetical protein [Gleimia sp. 6138-11-ORH1]MCS4484406.1 hypothetical protein [Gleimia sp. 6138-11-ORH1]